jgi:MOSC domain-containing protein YiiM
MELIGRVVRLQVQRSRLKPGPATTRVYNPTPLLEIAELVITPRGVVGDGVLDVHHVDHSDSRNVKLLNGVSVMTVSRYRALRETYGEHLADGIAGESLLLDTDHLDDLSGRLILETEAGLIGFESIPAPPCVEFSRFVIGRGAGDVGPEVMATLEALDHGARGYYLQTTGTGTVRAGTPLYRGQPAQPAQTPPVRSG